jgi:hypothetical protein
VVDKNPVSSYGNRRTIMCIFTLPSFPKGHIANWQRMPHDMSMLRLSEDRRPVSVSKISVTWVCSYQVSVIQAQRCVHYEGWATSYVGCRFVRSASSPLGLGSVLVWF